MFYKMIENACERWYYSSECTVTSVIDYIEAKGMMRDAQINAIKTYLYLKIHCESKALADLFCDGKFNTLNLENAEISNTVRQYLEKNPAAAALFEFACLKNEKGEQVSKKLEERIKKAPEDINYHKFFRDAFYNVSYTDYLFSLPMGAGKTYLMAAFIYLDLYFAMNEPQNTSFAHNFIIFAPSGLKSSVVPSLRTIQKFDPSWVLPEPAASDVKRMISFEVLDQSRTFKKSNKIKNPNVQKIANHQPLSELFGLVAVTNAEKVILDRIQEKDGQISLFDESDDDKDRQANELRNLIGKLPSMSIFIDEVHHAVKDEIKLRAVVNKWAENNTINSVIGFSGTPYLEKAEKISVTDELTVATAEIANIVYYYPLAKGIGNFLKRPVVKISEIADSVRIIENGVREFLDSYKDTVYDGSLAAKLGIYCGSIDKLEEAVYPLVSRIATEYGIGNDSILKFHKGNKQHPQPSDSQLQFDTLDTSLSKIRIVLLVQIGKEGWDCKSLAGIILSQKGDCPTNMVLQTSCRCLRQIQKGSIETALIYLNNEGMIVADFFGGSGVTAAAANKLNRSFIHCDIGINSIQTTRDRLMADKAQFDVLEIKDGVQLYRNPVQTMDKIKSLIQGLRQDDSLNSFWAGSISDSKMGTVPVYVPNLEDSSSKLLDTVMVNRVIHQAIPELDSNVKKVVVYYIDIADKEKVEKFIADDDSTTVEIELRDLKTVLDDVVVGDYAEFHCEESYEDLFGGYAVTIEKFVSDRVMHKIMEFNKKAFLNSSGKKPYKPIEISEDGLELIEFMSLDCTAPEGEWHSDSEIKIDKSGYVIKDGIKTKDFWDAKICCREKPLRIKIRNICGDETEWIIEGDGLS